MKLTMEEVENIIRNQNWNAAAQAILSCREITDRTKQLKEIYGDDNVALFSTKDYNSAYRHLLAGFKAGRKLEAISVPTLKGEPRNGNYRVLMINDGDAVEASYEEGGRRRLAAPQLAIAADDFQPGVTKRMN